VLTAAQDPQEHIDACLARERGVHAAATLIERSLRAAGYLVHSHANFVLARFADQETGDGLQWALTTTALICAPVGSYLNSPEALRITVRTADDWRTDTGVGRTSMAGDRT